MNLKNKTAIVTGGTKGIGRAIAEALVARRRLSLHQRSTSKRDRRSREANWADTRVALIGFVCDVRDYEQVKALIDYTVEELGGLDILVNNAGIGIFETVDEHFAGRFSRGA